MIQHNTEALERQGSMPLAISSLIELLVAASASLTQEEKADTLAALHV